MTSLREENAGREAESRTHHAVRIAAASVAILFAACLVIVLVHYLDYWMHSLKGPAAIVLNVALLAALVFISRLRNLIFAFLKVFALTLPFLIPLIALATILPHYLSRETADLITVGAMLADTALMFWVLCFAHRRHPHRRMGRIRTAAHRWSNLMPATHYFLSKDGSELRLIRRFLARKKQGPPD